MKKTKKAKKNKGGRPLKYNIDKLLGAIKLYTAQTDIPILAEFCYQYGISYKYIYQLAKRKGNKELSYSIKRLILKKEAQLEKLSLYGKIDKTQAIFSLKQLGWKDRIETDITSKGKSIGNVQSSKMAQDLYNLIYGHKNPTEGDEEATGTQGARGK